MGYSQISPLSNETFQPYVGQLFDVENTDMPIGLCLLEIEVSTKGRSWPPSLPKPFIMIFSGPHDHILLEGSRVIVAPDRTRFELYLIPIMMPDPAIRAQHYQAVIN